jgi:hypothetical protein
MFSSTVLETAIGLVFCFASISVVASTLYEGIASMFGMRAKTLLNGVKDLLNHDDSLILGIYNHALVNPRSDGKTKVDPNAAAKAPTPGAQERSAINPSTKPSYIDPKNFALAFMDTLEAVPGDWRALQKRIDGMQNNGQIKLLLQGMFARANYDMVKFRDDLAGWFDDAMDRVSGVYKRQSQLFTFVIALVVAAALNVDTFVLFGKLWQHTSGIAGLPALTSQDAKQALDHLQALPVGWAGLPDLPSIPLKLFGFVVTALSALFGAPFWFDILQRLVNVRGTGRKPGDKDAVQMTTIRSENAGTTR